MDRRPDWRENRRVLAPGACRRRIARTLTAAYGEGLLSEDTFQRRLDQTLGAGPIDPQPLVGDLNLRAAGAGIRARFQEALGHARLHLRGVRTGDEEPVALLGLDWTGAARELVLGRDPRCDVVLGDLGVSRRHAHLRFRDGSWVLQDLESTNGTTVNGTPVGRCELRPGDCLVLGSTQLWID
jgi:Inner membrane component of T3SS, cytoplasmic domain